MDKGGGRAERETFSIPHTGNLSGDSVFVLLYFPGMGESTSPEV
jgi:hypothetical protein